MADTGTKCSHLTSQSGFPQTSNTPSYLVMSTIRDSRHNSHVSQLNELSQCPLCGLQQGAVKNLAFVFWHIAIGEVDTQFQEKTVIHLSSYT